MLKSYFKVLQIEGGGFLYSPVGKADSSVRAELRLFATIITTDFLSIGDADEVQ